ncbi:MAG: hypothetical protein AAF526_12740 [Pseudomonadota bacterium]
MIGLRKMLAWPFRAIAYVAVIGAIFTGFWDLYQTAKTNVVQLTPLGQIWNELSPGTLNLTQAAIQRHLHPAVWEHGLFYFLLLPSFLALFILAGVVLFIGQLIYRPR